MITWHKMNKGVLVSPVILVLLFLKIVTYRNDHIPTIICCCLFPCGYSPSIVLFKDVLKTCLKTLKNYILH